MSYLPVITSSALIATISLLSGGASAVAQQWSSPCGPGHGWQQGSGYFQGQWDGSGSGASGGWQFAGRFVTIDQDQDGVVSAEEAAGNAELMFDVMDVNEDENLVLEEFMSVRMRSGAGYNPTRQQANQTRKADRFKAMDVDENGRVDKQEFMAAGEKRFQASDTDQNGQVTPWEFRASRWRL